MGRERKRFEIPGLEERLDQAFHEKGLSQGDLAKLCGLESYVVSRIMAGVLPESFDRFARVAWHLGVTWQWLLSGVEEAKLVSNDPPPRLAGGGPGGDDGPRHLQPRGKRRRA